MHYCHVFYIYNKGNSSIPLFNIIKSIKRKQNREQNNGTTDTLININRLFDNNCHIPDLVKKMVSLTCFMSRSSFRLHGNVKTTTKMTTLSDGIQYK